MEKRTIYIAKRGKLKEAIKEAKRLGIGEVVDGIPLSLCNKVSEKDLPCVYEEIVPEKVEGLDLESRIAELERKVKAIVGSSQ